MNPQEFEIKNDNLQFDESAPTKSEVTVKQLDAFLKKDDVLIFYGGEPLIEIPKMQEIMDFFGDKIQYRMQTNGLLLDRLPYKYLKQIRKILISIDGNKKRTDHNRGIGNYDRVLKNIKKIREEGYTGELVARMTIAREFPDVYNSVRSIIRLVNKGLFDSVHWQIDAGFYKADFEEVNFTKFIEQYNTSITRLMKWWITQMKKGKIYKLYPFIGISESVLRQEKTSMRCGAGHTGFAITTNGMISACPVTNAVKTFYAGNVNEASESIKPMTVQGDCLQCSYLDLCGGRCLYQNYARLWPKMGNALICQSVKHLIDAVKKKQPLLQALIDKKMISLKDFSYEKYFGPEIIP